MDLTGGQVQALLMKVCSGDPDILGQLLRDELSVELVARAKKLFDHTGRRISEGLKANVCDANREFRLDQPNLETENDYDKVLGRLYQSLGSNAGITAGQLKEESERLIALIKEDSQIANILKGVWLPVVLPQFTADDLGTVLEQYLKVVDKSYLATFGNRLFYDYRKGTLTASVGIIGRSRHDQLIEKMRQGPVIGIHFPNPLQGFSVNASCEQMESLPEGFVLSGMDTPIAMAMYPDILARDYNTPGLDLAAFVLKSAPSLNFKPGNDFLTFSRQNDLASAYAYSSGGLLFCG